jgi:hypothetical protein
MFQRITRCLVTAGLLTSFFACEEPAEPTTDEKTEAQAAQATPGSVAVEQAERLLERGEDAARARSLLEEALKSDTLTAEERANAILALSQALERQGDKDGAIRAVEEALAAHADDREWPTERYYKRLRKLLTGAETTTWPTLDQYGSYAPFAKVLVPYFPAAADGRVSARFIMAGGDDELSRKLGTWNIREAVRSMRESDCPLCDEDVNVQRSIRQSLWMVIPEQREKLDDAVTVYYFDLADGRIPERYESYLPMKVADIVKELEAGKSFVVAAERSGAPPSILLAAPRAAMLGDVETKLADLTELPLKPVYVDVPLKLRSSEIQAVMRKSYMPAGKACYETLLKTAPRAAGRIALHFAIGGDGSVSKVEIKTDDAGLDDATFLGCSESALEALRFPAQGQEVTTVTYPLVFDPE